jgi:PAS domain S-box-containing protein
LGVTELHHKQSEEALRANVENFRAILNSLGDGMITIDTGGIITGMNPKAEDLLGLKEKVAKGTPLAEVVNLYNTQSDDKIRNSYEKCLENGEIVGYTHHILLISKDGNEYRIAISCAPIKNPGGLITGMVLVFRDVTEEYALQNRVVESERQLRSLYDSMTEGVGQHDIVLDESGKAIDYRIIDINTRYEKILGLNRNDVIGKRASEVYGVDGTTYLEIFAAVAETGNPIQFELYFPPLKKHFSVSVSSPGKGKFATVFEDISGRKLTEERIRLQSAALEASANAVLITDRDGIILSTNPAFTKLTGYSQDEALGKNPRDLVKSDKHDVTFYKDLWDTILSGRIWHGDIINRRKDGKLYHEEQTIAPVQNADGKISHFIAIKQDVTDRKEAEQKLQEQQQELTKLNLRLEEKIDIQLAELHLAAKIQRNLLPKEMPIIPGYDISAINIPANEVGGDYFDFIRLDDHRIVIALGDVSGKGLAASLLMANLQAVIRGQALFNSSPKGCMERANKLLFHSTDSDKFVSLFYGILDTQKNTLLYVNAGHNLPIICSPGEEPATLANSGVLLGAFENVFYEEEEIFIKSDDQVLIYSDGVCEAMNGDRLEFGEEKLKSIIKSSCYMHPEQVRERTISAVQLHMRKTPQSDDMTLILLKRI